MQVVKSSDDSRIRSDILETRVEIDGGGVTLSGPDTSKSAEWRSVFFSGPGQARLTLDRGQKSAERTVGGEPRKRSNELMTLVIRPALSDQHLSVP